MITDEYGSEKLLSNFQALLQFLFWMGHDIQFFMAKKRALN